VIETERESSPSKLMSGPPSGYFIVVQEPQVDAPDDLTAFVGELAHRWQLLIAITAIGALIALTIALLMPPVYRAQTLVAPVTPNGPTPDPLRQLGGLAALANVELGSAGGRKQESLATLRSKDFARDFIQRNNLLPVLYAGRWDAREQRWRADDKAPTVGEAVQRFTHDVVDISDDRATDFVTVTVDWYSPQLAAQWANGLIEAVNEKLRADAISSAGRSLDYLNNELAKTNVVEIRQAIYKLIEQQVNNAMMANVQREYAYHVLDGAVAPEKRHSPKRSVITAVGAALGLFLGALVVYLRRERPRRATTTSAPHASD
jgi:LPS O-antigen subunit length determinant protein (WzzB/FepE family)